MPKLLFTRFIYKTFSDFSSVQTQLPHASLSLNCALGRCGTNPTDPMKVSWRGKWVKTKVSRRRDNQNFQPDSSHPFLAVCAEFHRFSLFPVG